MQISARRVVTKPGALLVIAGLASFVAPSLADSPSTTKISPLPPVAVKPPKDIPPLLESLVASGRVRLIRVFPTATPGLTGYVVLEGGEYQVVYGEGGYLLVGRLLSPAGVDLTARYQQQYVPRPNVAAVVARVENAGHLIVEGSSKAPVLYVFADPNCIYCHRFYEAAEPLVQVGALQLRWVLVGFLKSTSAGRAAAILSAPDPARALHANEDGFNVRAEAGATRPLPNVGVALKALLKLHLEQMGAVGGNGTPTLIYRTASGGWAAQVGVPSDGWLDRYARQGHA